MGTSTLSRPPRAPAPPPRSRLRWERPALLALLAGTASGYANDFYGAAVQAGNRSWKAWLFGSLDSGNAITVDKPPASLWVMTLSARIFGFTSWSLLVPQALRPAPVLDRRRTDARRITRIGVWTQVPGSGAMARRPDAAAPVPKRPCHRRRRPCPG